MSGVGAIGPATAVLSFVAAPAQASRGGGDLAATGSPYIATQPVSPYHSRSAAAVASFVERLPTPTTTNVPKYTPPGQEHGMLDGVSLLEPGSLAGAVLTNVVERFTGVHDARLGSALNQVILGGTQFVRAALRHAGQGTGVIATGSSLLSKIIPVAGIFGGVQQVWRGWNELGCPLNPVELLGSKVARTGMLGIASSSLLFLPGIGGLVGSGGLRLVAAANELDLFHELDAPPRVSQSVNG